jgi:hypothetical protein
MRLMRLLPMLPSLACRPRGGALAMAAASFTLPARARRRSDGRFLSIGSGLCATDRLLLRLRRLGGAPRRGAAFSSLRAGVRGLGGASGRKCVGVGVVERSRSCARDSPASRCAGEPGSIAGSSAGADRGDGAGDVVGVRSWSYDARGGASRPAEKTEEYWAARRV